MFLRFSTPLTERKTKMNKICKEYISEIKSLFPINRKMEKTYLNKMATDVDDFCEENNITTIDELYQNYGTPEDVVHNYISILDRKTLVKHINTTRLAKIIVASVLVAALAVTSIIGIYYYNIYQIAKSQEVVISYETIQSYD